MPKRKILTVLGARPQFIKASAVSAALLESHSLDEVVVHTGQHFDDNMSAVFFQELGMREPAFHCGVHGGGHADMTGRMLMQLEPLMLAEAPDAVLVYGDTNSTLAGALTAVKLGIPVAHVEAGLRSFNMAMPEEINRILTDRISRWLFVPTAHAAKHLAREGVAAERIHVVGDVMVDVARHHGGRCRQDAGLLASLARRHGIVPRAYCLATIHRAESTDHPERLDAILAALLRLSEELPIILPLHPRTRRLLQGTAMLKQLEQELIVLDPLGYLDMLQLEKFAALIATDSGGVQKEAFIHQVPCVTLREETEWTELVQAGWNRLAPPSDPDGILATLRAALGSRGQLIRPYGDGAAAVHITRCLEHALA
jgi:UDP-GlcNAc3NAcA epimerase